MSFKAMRREDLVAVATEYEAEIDDKFTKDEIIAALEEAGVTWAFYRKCERDKSVKNVELTQGEALAFGGGQVLLKMERKNPSFEICGIVFTRDNPYRLTDEATAQFIIDKAEGFRVATPREVKEFYG